MNAGSVVTALQLLGLNSSATDRTEYIDKL
jgi:hypothetical protein